MKIELLQGGILKLNAETQAEHYQIIALQEPTNGALTKESNTYFTLTLFLRSENG